MKNLAAEPALATEIERHRTLLAQWNKLTGESNHPIQPVPNAQRKTTQRAQQKQRNKR
jgi:hypothetical protein